MSDESSTESKSAASSVSELQFVSFTGPSDWNESSVRHAIRSHVTRYQHRHRARKSPDGSKSKGTKIAPKAERKASLAIPESKEERTSSRNSPKTPLELTPYSRLLGATQRNPADLSSDALSVPEEASAVFLISNPVHGGALGVKGLHIDTKLMLVCSSEYSFLQHRPGNKIDSIAICSTSSSNLAKVAQARRLASPVKGWS